MKGIRTLLAAGAAGAMALSLLPGPSAQAADAAVFVFTAGATVTGDTYAPGLGPGVSNSEYTLSTANAGIGGQKLCQAVSNTAAGSGSCTLVSTGAYGAGVGGLGGYCGYSSGSGVVSTAKIGTTSVLPANTTLEWPQSAGTVLPLIYRAGGNVIGVGAVQTTGAAPGTCGVGGPTRSFAVTGWSATAVA